MTTARTTAGATMRAAVYRRFGPPEVVQIEEVPKPAPGADDILIRVHASTVSAADYRSRSRNIPRGLGLLASPTLGVFTPRNTVLGMDAAGVVEAVGSNVTACAPNDEVIAMLGSGFGGHAEYVCVPQHAAVTTKPRTMTFEESVALVFGPITALAFLKRAGISPGDSVLVNGASGAVGSAAVQLATEMGAHVTGVCSAGNRELVLSLGADSVIDYATDDFTAQGASYDVIVDCVGNAPFERAEGSLAPDGALLLVITDLKGLFMAPLRSRKRGRLVSATGVTYTAEDLAFIVGLAESDRFRPVIDRTFEMSDIVDAHRYVDTGHKRGNVVVRIVPS